MLVLRDENEDLYVKNKDLRDENNNFYGRVI